MGAATYEWWPASVRNGLGIDNWVLLEVEDWTKRTQVKAAPDTDASFKQMTYCISQASPLRSVCPTFCVDEC
jgi:hypothetical protein